MGTLTLQGGVWVFGADSGGASQSYSSASFQTIDVNDGSWTKLNKSSLEVSGASYSSGVGTYTFNELTTGDVSYTQTRASYPVYYKQLTALNADGSTADVTTDNRFILSVKASEYQTNSDMSAAYAVLGITTDPTSTNAADFNIASGGVRWTSGGGTKRAAIVSGNNVATIGDADSRVAYFTILFTAGHQVSVSGYAVESDGSFNNLGARNSNKARSSGQPVYLTLGFPLHGNTATVAANDTLKVKLEHQIIVFDG